MDTLAKFIGGLLVSIVAIVFIALLFGLPIMWLWNWLMPIIFDVKEITFLQAAGLGILSGFLFKSSK